MWKTEIGRCYKLLHSEFQTSLVHRVRFCLETSPSSTSTTAAAAATTQPQIDSYVDVIRNQGLWEVMKVR